LRGVTVPVRVSGPLDALAWTIDWNAVAQEMLQQAQAAQRPAPGATPSSRRRATP